MLSDPTLHPTDDLRLPENSIPWTACVTVLARYDLALPTEVQWEAAARAGTRTRFYVGKSPLDLIVHANFRPDLVGPNGVPDYDVVRDEDGDPLPLFGKEWLDRPYPVGSFEPNPFGLHDVHGNVWEWCLDVVNSKEDVRPEPRPGDGLRTP